jgi:hypothetical protein
MPSNRFIAVGSPTRRDLDVIGSGLRGAFPLTDTDDFAFLLLEIDRVEQRRSATPPAGSPAGSIETPD